jgi:nucleotide-binding universal stress UspA family protein
MVDTEEAFMAIPYKKIIVPLDGSALSEQALPHAAALARQSQAELNVLRVTPYISEAIIAVDALPLDWQNLDEQQHRLTDEAMHYLQQIVVNLKFQQIEAKAVVEVGHAAEKIVEYAESHAADLIVMSTHGRTGLQRFLLGSVASKVASAAPCPVLLVRPQATV